MLTMLREFTVKEVDRRIAECENIWSVHLYDDDIFVYSLSFLQCSITTKLWGIQGMDDKDNMKSTVEQYKVSTEVVIKQTLIPQL